MADNKELKEEVSSKEEKGIAMEILGELKRQNERLVDINERQNDRLVEASKSQSKTITKFVVLIGLIIAGFLIYLYQYDFSGSIEQNGIYTLVDSEGNVISSDITPEQMEDILKIINGKDENNQKEN